MKREIRFRVWSKTEQKMYFVDHGDQFRCGDETEWAPWIFVFNNIDFVDADNFEIMQWTGLIDIGGNDVYEGDIVRYKSHSYLDSLAGNPMKWHDSIIEFKDFAFRLSSSDSDVGILNQKDDGKFEIIGNIHSNPELV